MSKTAKFSIFTAIVIVIAILAYLYASPYLALRNIQSAAQQGNSEKLNQYIDYPSIRQSLKDQLNAHMLKELQQEKNKEFAALGAMLATSVTDTLLDTVITPTGVGLMLQGKNLNPSHISNDNSGAEQQQDQTEDKVDYKAYYTSMNRFVVDVSNKQHHDQRIKVIMARDGLSWKLKELIIPLDNY